MATLPQDLEGADRQTAARPSTSIDAIPERLAVDAALAELPEEFRVPVVLRDLCDLDYAEIASVLDIPPGTVRSRIARGRAQLARLLDTRNQTVVPQRPTPRTGAARPPHGSPP